MSVMRLDSKKSIQTHCTAVCVDSVPLYAFTTGLNKIIFGIAEKIKFQFTNCHNHYMLLRQWSPIWDTNYLKLELRK